MAVFFVSRHAASHQWLRELMDDGRLQYEQITHASHLDLASVAAGDTVLGTLPLATAAAIQAKGARFISLDLKVPAEWRGRELGIQEMHACGATLTEYTVSAGRSMPLEPFPAQHDRVERDALTVVLVSGEVAPQVIGFDHYPTREVVMVVSDAMVASANVVKRVIRDRDADVATERIDFVSYSRWFTWASRWLQEQTRNGSREVYVNCTGGTKVMAMALADAARACAGVGLPVRAYYVNTEAGLMDRLDTSQTQPLKTCLNLADLLACQGIRVAATYSASSRFEREHVRAPLFDTLFQLPQETVGALNGVASRLVGNAQFVDSGVATAGVTQPLAQELSNSLGQALVDAGCLTCLPKLTNNHVKLTMAFHEKGRIGEELDFMRGGWLEAYVGRLLKSMDVDDWAVGAEIVDAAGVPNEIDAIATSGNRLLVMELKTSNQARYDGADGDQRSRVAEHGVYKAASVGARVARIFADRWYVSLRPLDQADAKRAESLRIRVFVLQNAAARTHFETELGKWVDRSRLEAHRDGYARAQFAAVTMKRRPAAPHKAKPPGAQPGRRAGRAGNSGGSKRGSHAAPAKPAAPKGQKTAHPTKKPKPTKPTKDQPMWEALAPLRDKLRGGEPAPD